MEQMGFGPGQPPAPEQPQAPQSLEEAFPARKATDKQQEQYNKMYAGSVIMLYDKGFMGHAEEMLNEAPNVVEGMAQIGAALAARITSLAKQSGDPIEPIVLVEGGREVMAEVAEFADLVGHTVSPEDMENAYLRASDIVRQAMIDGGEIDMDAFEAEAEQVRGIVDQGELSAMNERMAMHKGATMEAMRKGAGQ